MAVEDVFSTTGRGADIPDIARKESSRMLCLALEVFAAPPPHRLPAVQRLAAPKGNSE